MNYKKKFDGLDRSNYTMKDYIWINQIVQLLVQRGATLHEIYVEVMNAHYTITETALVEPAYEKFRGIIEADGYAEAIAKTATLWQCAELASQMGYGPGNDPTPHTMDSIMQLAVSKMTAGL